MPPVIPAVAAMAAAMVANLTLTQVLILGAISLTTSVLGGLLAPKPSAPSYRGEARDRKQVIRSAIQSRRKIYGIVKASGPLIYAGSSGDGNKYVHIVIPLAGHQCHAIGDVYFNDKPASEYDSSYCRIKKHLGSPDQEADPDLVAEVGEWTVDHRGQGVAYIYVRFLDSQDIWPTGLPNVSAVVEGALLYDPRTAINAFAANWALCMRDYLTDPVLGLGYAATDIDEAWAIASANISDEQVEVQPGVYQPRYTCNGAVDTSVDPATIIDQLRSAGAGFVLPIQGKLRIIAGAYYAPTGPALTAHDLRGPIKVRPKPPRRDLFNGVRGVFTSPDNHYEPTDFPLVKNATYKAQDGGVEIIRDIDLPFTNDPWMAQRITKIVLEKSRQGIVVEFPANWGALNRCVGETLYLDFDGGLGEPSLGWSDKVFRIESWALAQDGGGIDLVLQEEAAASYAWNFGEATAVDPAPDTSLASPATLPPEVGNVQIVEENYAYRLRTFTRLQVSWQFPVNYPWFDYVEVWLSLDGGVTYTHHSSPKYTITNPGFTLDPVEEGQTYYLRLITVSIHGKRSATATTVSRTVTGRGATAPESLAGLACIVGENSSIRAWGEQLSDPDVELYEFRLGWAWDSGIFLAALSSPNLPLPGVKPGNHTLFANTKSSNGLYGLTPVSAYVSLADPPDHWSVVASHAGDYSSGTFANTAMVSYSGANHLKCSHTAGLLTGSYKSAVIDKGATGRYLAYLLADAVITGAGQTWAEVVPGATTWAQLDVSRRWREIFQPQAAPVIRMRLWYGDTNPPTNVVDRLEILSAIVEGRYYQVEIEITDPALTITGLVEGYTLKLCQ